MNVKPKLDQVTLCCVDTAQPLAAIRALNCCLSQCDFASALLLTDADVSAPGIEVRAIDPIAGMEEYSAFIMKRLLPHIATPFVLIVQWDGYVLDGSRWEPGFCEFDYIGAIWPWGQEGHQVGNGGFSLRSRRLLEILAGDEFPPAHPEDLAICQLRRADLEERGIRIADADTAFRFSFERDNPTDPDRVAFGFHGVYNFWRMIPAEELEGLLSSLPARTFRAIEMADWISALVDSNRWEEARSVLLHYEAHNGEESGAEALTRHVDAEAAKRLRAKILRAGAEEPTPEPHLEQVAYADAAPPPQDSADSGA